MTKRRRPAKSPAPYEIDRIEFVGISAGALTSLDKARKGLGAPVSRELLLSGLCHVSAMCLGSKRATHVAVRKMFVRALAETMLEVADDDGGDPDEQAPSKDMLAPADVRRVIHEALDSMAGYLSGVVDNDPGAAVSEIARIRQAVGPVLQKPHDRRVQPGFDGRA
jgi:hypothetical protein